MDKAQIDRLIYQHTGIREDQFPDEYEGQYKLCKAVIAEMYAEDQMCLHMAIDENASVAALEAPLAAQDAEEAMALWDAAIEHAAVYVEHHCDDGEWHADAIRRIGRPTVQALEAPRAAPPEPKLTLALPAYDKRRIVIASDEVIDGERIVCVAIEEAPRAALPEDAKDQYIAELEAQIVSHPQQPNWSESQTLPSELWKNPLLPMNERLEIADGAVAFRDKVIANLRQQLAEKEVPRAALPDEAK